MKIRHYTNIKTILSLIISIALIIYVFNTINFNHITISKIDVKFFLISLVISILSILFRAVFYYISLGSTVSFIFIYKVTGVYNFLSSVLPFGIGHISFPHLMYRYKKVRLSNAVLSLGLYNLIRVFIFIIILLVIMFNFNLFNFITVSYSRLITIFILFSCSIVLFILFKNIKIFLKITNFIQNFFLTLKEDYGKISISVFLKLFLYSVCIISLNLSFFYFLYLSVGYSLSMSCVALVLSIVNLSNLLPIHGIGRFGSYEVANMVALIPFGIAKNDAVQLAFYTHIISLTIQMLIALPCYVSLKYTQSRKKTDE